MNNRHGTAERDLDAEREAILARATTLSPEILRAIALAGVDGPGEPRVQLTISTQGTADADTQ